jgi:hypothetical protein
MFGKVTEPFEYFLSFNYSKISKINSSGYFVVIYFIFITRVFISKKLSSPNILGLYIDSNINNRCSYLKRSTSFSSSSICFLYLSHIFLYCGCKYLSLFKTLCYLINDISSYSSSLSVLLLSIS